jgi:uncharacterized membrane protein (UPF0127 family)
MSKKISNFKVKITKLSLLVIMVPLLAIGCNKNSTPVTTTYDQFQVGEATLNVEVENTESGREVGLSGRASLPQDQGMLFVFETADRYGFWMKGMQFPLDFIWIKAGRVAEITRDIPIEPGVADNALHDYRPLESIDSILEVNAGWALAHNIQINDPAVLLLSGKRP